MPCGNKPNLNISRLVTDRVRTDIKITNNIKMSPIMVSFSARYISIFIDRVPYKHKKLQFHGILIISFETSILSHYMQKVKSWNMQNPALRKPAPSFSKNFTSHKNLKIS